MERPPWLLQEGWLINVIIPVMAKCVTQWIVLCDLDLLCYDDKTWRRSAIPIMRLRHRRADGSSVQELLHLQKWKIYCSISQQKWPTAWPALNDGEILLHSKQSQNTTCSARHCAGMGNEQTVNYLVRKVSQNTCVSCNMKKMVGSVGR